jgi:hypothetical protein
VDKNEKRDALRAYKARELEHARAKMCLTPDQLDGLLDHLEEVLFRAKSPCDHTLTHTRAWAVSADLDPERILASVREFDGFCDCEVAMNVTHDRFGWESKT